MPGFGVSCLRYRRHCAPVHVSTGRVVMHNHLRDAVVRCGILLTDSIPALLLDLEVKRQASYEQARYSDAQARGECDNIRPAEPSAIRRCRWLLCFGRRRAA